MLDLIRARFQETSAVLRRSEEHLARRLAETAEMIIAAYNSGRGVFLFGNGGSAADAQHIAGELVGRLITDRRALKAIALSTDTSVLTCVGNDYGYDRVFSRQLEANAIAGDVAIALSTSGNSPNVLAALQIARVIGMKTVAFTGSGGGKCAELCDILLDVPVDGPSCRIQEAHMVLYHVLCELIENAFVEK